MQGKNSLAVTDFHQGYISSNTHNTVMIQTDLSTHNGEANQVLHHCCVQGSQTESGSLNLEQLSYTMKNNDGIGNSCGKTQLCKLTKSDYKVCQGNQQNISSIITNHVTQHSTQLDRLSCGLQNCLISASTLHPYQFETPKKSGGSRESKYLAGLRQKAIHNITQTTTIQSKYVEEGTTLYKQEESQLVFKGSRDPLHIEPIKFTFSLSDSKNSAGTPLKYSDYSGQSSVSRSPFNTASPLNTDNPLSSQLDFRNWHLLTSCREWCLIRNMLDNSVFSLIKLGIDQELLTLQSCSTDLLDVYHVHETTTGQTWVFAQPFHYTLQQLITHKKVTSQNYSIVWNKLKTGIELVERVKHNLNKETTIVEYLQRYIYSVHGQFKILPVRSKPKTIQTIMQTIYNKIRIKVEQP